MTVDVLGKIDAVLDEFVSWDGRSDDAADSTADDLDQLALCYACGWDQDYSDGLAHDAWYPENSHAEPHEYVPGPQETGEVIVSLMGRYELDGVARCPGGNNEDDPGVAQWALYALFMRTENDEEPFLDLLADDLTVQEAVDMAAKLGYGWPLGV